MKNSNYKKIYTHLPFKYAYQTQENGELIKVNAENLTRKDKIFEYICPCCTRPAFFRFNYPNKANCFVIKGQHAKGCPVGRPATRAIKNDECKIAVKSILNRIDSNPPVKKAGGSIDNEKFKIPDDFSIYDIASTVIEKEEPTTLTRIGPIYDLYMSGGGFENTDLNLTINDLFLTREKLAKYGIQGLAGKPLIIVMERCTKRTSIKSIDDSYIWLRVISEITGTKEIYVALKINNAIRNRNFQGRVTGYKKGIKRSSKTHIVIFGYLQKIVGNDQRTCYKLICSDTAIAFKNHKGFLDE